MMDRIQRVQEVIDEKLYRIGKGKYARVLQKARKPTREEYEKVLMVTGAGIVLIGLLGFAIYYIIDIVLGLP